MSWKSASSIPSRLVVLDLLKIDEQQIYDCVEISNIQTLAIVLNFIKNEMQVRARKNASKFKKILWMFLHQNILSYCHSSKHDYMGSSGGKTFLQKLYFGFYLHIFRELLDTQ